MQYHYVVGYDTDTKKWFLELDTLAYFSDGNLWDEELHRKQFWAWRVPDDDSEDILDNHLLNTLQSLIDTIPVPEEA